MTNETKQTAVDFYITKLIDILGDEICNNITIEQNNRIAKLEKQAKEMEKVQHRITWGNALSAINVDKWESFEQYYNETYGGNNNG